MTKGPKPFILFHNGGVGDFLMFMFLSQQLYQSGIASHITLVVPRAGAFLRGLIEQCPYMTLLEASRREPWTFVWLLRQGMRRVGVIVYPTLGRIPLRLKLLAWLMTRMPQSTLIGFADKGPLCNVLYTTLLPYDTNINYADLMRTTAQVAGATPDPKPPRVSLRTVPNLRKRYGLEQHPYIVLHPGAGMSTRRRSFADEDVLQLVSHVLDTYPELHVVLSGGPDERVWVEGLAKQLENNRVQAVVAAPAAELGGLITEALCYIGGDTGVTHLACFVGAAVIEVPHHGTKHWLCYYCPSAVVLYRLEGEEVARTEQDYLLRKAPDGIWPFTTVPVESVIQEVERTLAARGIIESHRYA